MQIPPRSASGCARRREARPRARKSVRIAREDAVRGAGPRAGRVSHAAARRYELALECWTASSGNAGSFPLSRTPRALPTRIGVQSMLMRLGLPAVLLLAAALRCAPRQNGYGNELLHRGFGA